MNQLKEAEEEIGNVDPRRKLPIEIHIGSVLLAIMTGILFIQVVARFIFNNSFSWSEELSRYMFVWMVFLGVGALIQLSEHITIDVLSDRVPARYRRASEQTLIAIMTTVNVILLLVAWRITFVVFELGQVSPAMGMPFWIVYAAMPTGLSIAVVRAIVSSVKLWRPDTSFDTPAVGLDRPQDPEATNTGESR